MQTQPVENIEAVLSRFQAWTGPRKAVAEKPGIRELSEDEALQSGRYKWQPAKKLGAESGVFPEEAPAEERTEASRSARTTTRNVTNKVGAKGATNLKAARVENTRAKVLRPAKTPAAQEFREALAQTVAPPGVLIPATQTRLSRPAAISVRLTTAERELMKSRAAESGITPSAYIRQCALEVEQLRAQVGQAIAAMERGSPAQLEAPAQTPGLFSRIARRIFSGAAPTIAVRA